MIYFDYFISRLKKSGSRGVFVNRGNNGRGHSACLNGWYGCNRGNYQKSQQNIHSRARYEYYNFRQRLFWTERAFTARILVLAFHFAKSAHWYGAYWIKRFLALLFPYSGSHTQSKFKNIYVKCFCGNKMTELVNEYYNWKYDYCTDYCKQHI